MMEGSKSVWEYVVRHDKKNSRAVITNEESKRKCSYAYFFRHGRTEMKVCKGMFIKTLNISNTVIQS